MTQAVKCIFFISLKLLIYFYVFDIIEKIIKLEGSLNKNEKNKLV